MDCLLIGFVFAGIGGAVALLAVIASRQGKTPAQYRAEEAAARARVRPVAIALIVTGLAIGAIMLAGFALLAATLLAS